MTLVIVLKQRKAEFVQEITQLKPTQNSVCEHQLFCSSVK